MRFWLGLGLLLGLAGPALTQEPTHLRFLQWSDMHAGGEHYCSWAWEEALQQGLAWGPQALVLTGDHGDNAEDPASFSPRMLGFLRQMARELQDVPVPLMQCLGNNDLRENYQTDPDLLNQTQSVYTEAFGTRYYLNNLGNGVSPFRVGGLKWITLNSQIFGTRNRYSGADEQARRSLDWLERELADNAEGPVVILAHIPPTIDLWDGLPAWRADCQQRLQSILMSYPGWVGIVAGHYHRNEIHCFHRPQGDVPILVAGSLSSKYLFAPNWRTCDWTLDGKGIPTELDYEVRYPAHPEWDQAYQYHDMDSFEAHLRNRRGFYARYLRDLFPHVPDYQAHSQSQETFANLIEQLWLTGDGRRE